jgi:hypothetical protein
MVCGPRFFVALAHTDTIAYFSTIEDPERFRVSNLNLFPGSMKENLLFSMSFDSAIHYQTMQSNLDPMANNQSLSNPSSPAKRLFADCGAFQFRDSEIPVLKDGTLLTHEVAWEYYSRKHLKSSHAWDEVLLCSPDHIVMSDMSDEEVKSRFDFIRKNAGLFLELSKQDSRVIAVGVIHGRTNQERIEQYEMFKQLGYRYVALGGMVPYSTKHDIALDIVAGIQDSSKPRVGQNSILGRCRKDGIKLHIFGLNSPEWYRWWFRLNIDSFDGSKLSTEGAANGWYWLAKDNKFDGRAFPEKPSTVSELYHRIAVKKMGAESWNWTAENGVLTPHVPETESGVDTSCDCPACQYLKTARCTSDRCWYWKLNPKSRHVCDPRMMGSTEHNMGRVAHNAFVYSWLIEQIKRLNEIADNSNLEGEEEWLRNWTTIEVGS